VLKPFSLLAIERSKAASVLAKGRKISKQVLGEDHVNKSIAGVGEFRAGRWRNGRPSSVERLWTRPRLGHRARSIVNLAMRDALKAAPPTEAAHQGDRSRTG
jgi:hypothetical protein